MAEDKKEKAEKPHKAEKSEKVEKKAKGDGEKKGGEKKGGEKKAGKGKKGELGYELAPEGKADQKLGPARLRMRYEKELIPVLMKEFGFKNRMEVPRLTKVVVNMGLGEAITSPKSWPPSRVRSPSSRGPERPSPTSSSARASRSAPW
jgi:large subunit ribosomal protein L5